MMTVITETTLEPGQEAEWDQAFEEGLAAARQQPGWVGVQLLIPVDAPNTRVVVGTWQDRAAWEAWHQTDTFRQTRPRMNEADRPHGHARWFQVVSVASSRA